MTKVKPRRRSGTDYAASTNEQVRFFYKSVQLQSGEILRGSLRTAVVGAQSSGAGNAAAVALIRRRRSKRQFLDRKQLNDSRLKRMNAGRLRHKEYPTGIGTILRINRPGQLGESIPRTTVKINPKSEIAPVAILEKFSGVVDAIEGETAFVTLMSESGEELIGEYPTSEFAKLGIRNRRRFTCQTVVANGEVEVRFQPIPDVEVTPEEEAAIDRELDELISGGELDGEY